MSDRYKLPVGKPDFYDIFQRHSAVMMLVDDESGDIIQANQSAARYYGYEPDVLCSLNIAQINTQGKDAISKHMQEAADERKNCFVFEHKKADGSKRIVEVFSTPLFNRDKKLLLSIVHDITERVEVESELATLNEKLSKEANELGSRFQGVFENSGIGILLLELDGVIIDSNPAFSVMTGIEEAMLKGANLHDFFEDDKENILSNISSLGLDFVQIEKTVTSKKGAIIPVNVTVSPIRKNSGEDDYLLCIIENISYKKSIEKKQKEQEILLIQQSKMAAMGEMIGAIAHQWRQPLNALGLMVQDLKSAHEYNELDAAYIQDMIEKSMSQIHFMSNTIESFRNFFKPSKDKELFSPVSALKEVLSMMSAQMNNNNIAISMDVDECAKFMLFGFKNEFKQVILNILANAKDAILESSNAGSIDILAKTVDDIFYLSFEDSGGGIEESIIARVFEPYFSTKEQGKGTGIGLYMSKIIIEEHMGGALSVANTKDGAIFTVKLSSKID